MLTRRLFLSTLTAATLAGPALAAETPEGRIKAIYGEYIRADKNSSDGPDQLDPNFYSARRRAQITKLQEVCKDKDWCLPDADFLIDGQDFKITRLVVRKIGGTATRPVVEAKFRNFGKPTTIRFELVKEEGRGWVIDELRQVGSSSRLNDFLTPIPESR